MLRLLFLERHIESLIKHYRHSEFQALIPAVIIGQQLDHQRNRNKNVGI